MPSRAFAGRSRLAGATRGLLLLPSLAFAVACPDGKKPTEPRETDPRRTEVRPSQIALEPGGRLAVAQNASTGVSALVLDEAGRPMPGAPVSWSVDDALVVSLSSTSSQSGGAIRVSGARPGAAALTARSGSVEARVAVTVYGPPARVTAIAGTLGQTAVAGSLVPVTPGVTVVDSRGTGVPGVAVHFALRTPGGTLSGTDPTTDASGNASLGAWRLRPTAGPDTVQATVAGLPPVLFVASATRPPLGTLALTVRGLPNGVPGRVSITGPTGYGADAAVSTTFTNVPAGAYTIAAAAVTAGNLAYVPTPATQGATVADGGTTAVSVSYAQSFNTVTISGAGDGNGRVQAPGVPDCSITAGRASGGCVITLATGSTLTLTSEAAIGSRFVQWGGACTGTAPTCTLRVDRNLSVTSDIRRAGSASTAPSQGRCYLGSFSTGATYLLSSFGSPAVDAAFGQEVQYQRAFFMNVPATVYIMNDGSPATANAMASPGGYILFGYYMFYKTIATYGDLAVSGVLAHEWGHRVQDVGGWHDAYPTVVTELEADAFSGFFMAYAKQWTWSRIQGYFLNTYASGSYNFNDPEFHGTPNQRVAAANLGVNIAVQVARSGGFVTYAQLHQAFMLGLQSFLAADVSPAVRDPSAGAPAPDDTTAASLRSVVRRLPLREIAEGRTRGADVVAPPHPARSPFAGEPERR